MLFIPTLSAVASGNVYVYTSDIRTGIAGEIIMLTKMKKWGNSQGLRFPKAILEEARMAVGDEVTVSVRGRKIIIEPVKKIRGRYDLKELVSKMPKD